MSEGPDPKGPARDDRQYIELAEQRGLEMVAIDPPTEGLIVNVADPAPASDNFED